MSPRFARFLFPIPVFQSATHRTPFNRADDHPDL